MIWIVLALLVIIVLWFFGTYNSFIGLNTRADEAMSDIQVQMKLRYDLVPNLVETVKGYASHEDKVFEKVTEARANAISAGDKGLAQQSAAENTFTGALKSVFAVAEAYPELKASEGFQQLSAQLSDIEAKIMSARRFYNANVRDLNIRIQSIPSSVVAGLMHLSKREFFELDEADSAAKDPVKVSFN